MCARIAWYRIRQKRVLCKLHGLLGTTNHVNHPLSSDLKTVEYSFQQDECHRFDSLPDNIEGLQYIQDRNVVRTETPFEGSFATMVFLGTSARNQDGQHLPPLIESMAFFSPLGWIVVGRQYARRKQRSSRLIGGMAPVHICGYKHILRQQGSSRSSLTVFPSLQKNHCHAHVKETLSHKDRLKRPVSAAVVVL